MLGSYFGPVLRVQSGCGNSSERISEFLFTLVLPSRKLELLCIETGQCCARMGAGFTALIRACGEGKKEAVVVLSQVRTLFTN